MLLKNKTFGELEKTAAKIGNGVAAHFIFERSELELASILLGVESQYALFEEFTSVDKLNITKEKLKAGHELKRYLLYRAAYFPTAHPILYRTNDKYCFLPESQKQKLFKSSMQELRGMAMINDNLPALESLLFRENFPETVVLLEVEKEYDIYKYLVKMLKDLRINDSTYIVEEFQHFLMAKICIPESFEQ